MPIDISDCFLLFSKPEHSTALLLYRCTPSCTIHNHALPIYAWAHVTYHEAEDWNKKKINKITYTSTSTLQSTKGSKSCDRKTIIRTISLGKIHRSQHTLQYSQNYSTIMCGGLNKLVKNHDTRIATYSLTIPGARARRLQFGKSPE